MAAIVWLRTSFSFWGTRWCSICLFKGKLQFCRSEDGIYCMSHLSAGKIQRWGIPPMHRGFKFFLNSKHSFDDVNKWLFEEDFFTFKCQRKINFPSPRSKLRGGKEIRWKRPKNFWKNALESFQWKLSKFPLGSFFWIAAKQRLFICMRKKKDETDYWANKKEARRKTNKKLGKIEWKLNV